MSDDFRRKMLAIDSKLKHTAEQDFAGVRQWYYSLPAEPRGSLRHHMQSLAEISEHMKVWDMFVKVHWSCDQTNEGNVNFAVGATQAPQDWLQAIDQWDKTVPLFEGKEKEA